jgi:nitrous oxide reductase accessory protein NosL
MRRFSLFFILLFLFACEKKIDLGVHDVHWDRDMCIRCKMVVSDRNYAAQTTDPKSGKTYYFDDIGCLVLWFKEDDIDWAEKAKVWVTDVETKEWIDARKAKYSTISITPMAFGFAAHKAGSEPKDVEIIDFDEMAKKCIALEEMKKGSKI